jgi:TonB-linked SusC/RagA family outer membrane protein
MLSKLKRAHYIRSIATACILPQLLCWLVVPAYADTGTNNFKTIGRSPVFASNFEKIITGRITDEKGDGLEGVSITEKGTGNTVTTGREGNYQISVKENAILVISFIGYSTQEIRVSTQNILDIQMKLDSGEMSEVVVTALSVKRDEKSLGYAVTKVEGKTVRESSELNLVNALAGRVAGVQISASSSGADASSSIIIRGQSSLRGNNQPLFVIDGVQIDNNPVSIADNFSDVGRDFGNNISDINPDDIESISVLKGPNAAALYGSRAANGVIIITTKKGKKTEGVGLTYSSTYLKEKTYDILPLQNSFGSGEGPRFTDGFFGTKPDGTPILGVAWNNFGPKMDGTSVVDFDGKIRPYSPSPDNIANFYQTGSSYINNIAFGGANTDGTSTYRISLTGRNKQGIIPTNTSDKYTFDFRGTQKITKFLSADISTSYNKSKGKGRPIIGNGPFVTRYAGFYPREMSNEVYKENYKQDNGAKSAYCPYCYTNTYWELYENKNTDESSRLIGSVDLDFTLTNWLTLKIKGSTDGVERYFEQSTSGTGPSGIGVDASFSTTQQVSKQFTYEFLFSANRKISKNVNLALNVGGQQWDAKFRSIGASTRNGLRTPGFYSISNSAIDPLGTANFSHRRINALYGFGQLAYKNFLFLDFTGRNDWSSTLPVQNNSYFYPSVSASFAFTDALKMNKEILSFGKLRASWAQVGNDAQQAYVLSPVYFSAGTFGSTPLIASPTTVPPANLKPEKTKSIELGLDLRFIKNRIRLDMNWYKSNTIDQIIELDVAESSGASRALVNAGEIENKGIELMLSATPVSKPKFSWDIGFNYSRNRNKVVELNGLESIPIAINNDGPVVIEARPGQPYGNIVVWVPEKNNKGQTIVNPNGQIANNYKREVVGNIQPDWTGGITNSISYKRFSLNSLIEFSMGGEYYSYNKRWLTARGASIESLYGRDADHGGLTWTDGLGRVRNDGIIAQGVDRNGAANSVIVPVVDYYNNSYQNNFPEHILDASYIMLREVSISYVFSKRLLSHTPIQQAGISLIGRNLAILSNGSKINNPIAISYGTGNGSRGIESGSFAPSRFYGISFNVTF